MHARLKVRRWGTARAPLLQGGWYPAQHWQENTYELTVDGQRVKIAAVVLELTEQERETAVWAVDVKSHQAFVVCPAGHHITEGVAPAKPWAACGRCGKTFEIET